MEEEASEKLAQLQHENTKLQNDLIHLQNYMASLEDHYYVVNRSLSEKENLIKSLKQEMTIMSQNIKEKELLIESLEEIKESITEKKKELIHENESLKVRLHEEKLKSKEMESLKIKEEELKNTIARAEEQNSTLLSELSIKIKEHSSSVHEVNHLQLQIKELEEKIKTMADALFFREQVKSTGSSDNVEKFPGKELEQCSPSPKSETNLLETNGSRLTSSFKKEKFVSLREEMLEAEVQDKRSKIKNLEMLLNKKEEEEARRDKLIMELKENLERAKHLNYDWKTDSRPDGQSGECKPLTEVPTFAVVVKDGVQTTQPGAIRIVETISIASQTDPIKILSPVLQSDEYETFTAGQYHSPSDSDDEGHPLSLGKENEKGTGLQLFSQHKNFDLDMDIYRMLKRSETDISGIEELGESSSEKDSNNSRDVNLNSKNYVDCNLKGAYCESGDDRNVTFDLSFPEETMSSIEVNSETGEERKGARRKEEFDSNQTTQPDSINVTKCVEALVPVSNSTPKPESSLSPKACTFLIPKTIGADTEENENEKTNMKTKSFPKQNSLLSPEETEKKFQDLSFAFKTDSMTIRERLVLLKRKRDQDEVNIENELKGIKTKLESFQSLAANSEYLNLMSDLKKQLDFVWNATIQLSSSAESYGYTQHEERWLEFFSVMVQHMENVQSNESSKISNKTKGEDKRPQTTSSLDNESDEERIQRRRSLAAVAFEGPSRRRASIATLPRSPMSEVGSNSKGIPWASCNRISCSTSKKLSFSQKTPSRAYISSSPGVEETKRDLITTRRRSDSRTSESMKDIDECLERRISTATDTDALAQVDADDSIDEPSFHLRQMYESVEDLRQCSLSTESVSVVYCLRRIVKWNKLVIKATRFRWPDQVFHYVPFYITWYVVFVLALVFAGGLFTGINGCYTYSRLECSLVWFAVLNFLLVVRRLYRILLLLFFVLLLVLNLLWLWLTKVVFPVMSEEEMDSFLRTFGFVVEIRYPNGPPPI